MQMAILCPSLMAKFLFGKRGCSSFHAAEGMAQSYYGAPRMERKILSLTDI